MLLKVSQFLVSENKLSLHIRFHTFAETISEALSYFAFFPTALVKIPECRAHPKLEKGGEDLYPFEPQKPPFNLPGTLLSSQSMPSVVAFLMCQSNIFLLFPVIQSNTNLGIAMKRFLQI